MRKVSVIAITVTYLDMTFATTANITSVVETGDYFVRTVICTIIWASFPMSHVDDMRGDRMDDLISRQEAIDALRKLSREDGYIDMPHEYVTDAVRALPSAQPKQTASNILQDLPTSPLLVGKMPSAQSEIIHCKDCKWKNGHNCTRAVEVFIDDDKYCAWAERQKE